MSDFMKRCPQCHLEYDVRYRHTCGESSEEDEGIVGTMTNLAITEAVIDALDTPSIDTSPDPAPSSDFDGFGGGGGFDGGGGGSDF